MSGKDEKKRPHKTETPEQEECRKAAEKAMNLLLTQDRTRKELQERLYRAGFSEQASEYAMNYVTGFGYIDDLRYAANYISYHGKKRSRKELRYKLMGKGVDSAVIAEAFEDYEPEDEREALRSALRKRLKGKGLSVADHKEKNKIIAYLAGKGYPLSAIKQIMREQEEMESNENL